MLLWLTVALSAAQSSDQLVLQRISAQHELRLADGAPHISPAVYERALDGEVVTQLTTVSGTPAAKAWGVAVVDAPIERVWAAVNDDVGLANLLPVEHSEVVRGEPGSHRRQVLETLPLPLLRDRWWLVEIEHNAELYAQTEGAAWEQAWRDIDAPLTAEQAAVVDGAVSVAWTRGAWLAVALPSDRTLLEYYTWSDPGGSVPAGPASRFARGAVRDALLAVRDLASHPRAGGPQPLRPDGSPLSGR